MSDVQTDTNEGQGQDQQPQDAQPQDAPANVTDTAKTETPAKTFSQPEVEQMIKDRLDRERKKAEDAAAKAAAEAERKAAEEQGKYKELYEKLTADVAARDAEIERMQKAAWKAEAAKKIGLPDGLAARIQGDTLDEMLADAEELLNAMPKPAAPNINAGGGNGRLPAAVEALGGLTPEEFAARFNLSVESVKQVINGG